MIIFCTVCILVIHSLLAVRFIAGENLMKENFEVNNVIPNNHLDAYFQRIIGAFAKKTFKITNIINNEWAAKIERISNILNQYNKNKITISEEDAQKIMHCLSEMSSNDSIQESEFQELQYLYKKLTGIPAIKQIRDGDELRNINSYEYLRNFISALSEAKEEFTNNEYRAMKITLEVISKKYDPTYNYGDLYTSFLLKLEKLTKAKSSLAEKLIKPVYINHSLMLERSYLLIQPVLKKYNQTSSKCEQGVRNHLKVKNKKQVNSISPRDTDTHLAKFENKIYARNVRPQTTSSQVSIRSYSHLKRSDPIEIRMGTQGIFNNFKAEVYSIFTTWLKEVSINKQNLNFSSKVNHIYFNMLPLDRSNPKKSVKTFFSPSAHNTYSEVQFAEQLHTINEEEHNAVFITLPSSRGLLDRKASKKTYDEFFLKLLEVTSGTSQERIKDVKMSNYTKKLLYGEKNSSYDKEQEKIALSALIQETFNRCGFKSGDELSAEDQQMLSFHFFKHDLPKFIIENLNPKSFNFSCWDGIDRAGIASVYYNLIESIERGTPISQEEFECALHGAPAGVKERSINNQIKLLWSGLNYYVQSNSEMKIPQWLSNWLTQNDPQPKTEVKDYKNYSTEEIVFIAASMGMYAYLRNCVDRREESLTSATAVLKIAIAVVLPPVAMLVGLFSLLFDLNQNIKKKNDTDSRHSNGSHLDIPITVSNATI